MTGFDKRQGLRDLWRRGARGRTRATTSARGFQARAVRPPAALGGGGQNSHGLILKNRKENNRTQQKNARTHQEHDRTNQNLERARANQDPRDYWRRGFEARIHTKYNAENTTVTYQNAPETRHNTPGAPENAQEPRESTREPTISNTN